MRRLRGTSENLGSSSLSILHEPGLVASTLLSPICAARVYMHPACRLLGSCAAASLDPGIRRFSFLSLLPNEICPCDYLCSLSRGQTAHASRVALGLWHQHSDTL